MNTPHLLEMVTAMMRSIMLIVPLMVVIVVALVYSQNIVLNVNVTMNQKPEMEFRMLLLQMVSVMMRPTI